jgi:flavorubredoxin
MYHARDEARHIIADELEWKRVHDAMGSADIDAAVTDFIELVSAIDGILQAQAATDVDYFCSVKEGLSEANRNRLAAGVLGAYRWQYIMSGVSVPRFQAQLGAKITPQQFQRISDALAPIAAAI